MRKALAILATVATVGATTISAPAQARGLGPGLAFGLAAGAIAAGVAGAYGPYYYGPGYGYYGPRYYGYYGPPAYYGPGPYGRAALSASVLASLVTKKARSIAPGFLLTGFERYVQNDGRLKPLQALPRVVA